MPRSNSLARAGSSTEFSSSLLNGNTEMWSWHEREQTMSHYGKFLLSKEFIEVSHVNNQPWTKATLLMEREQFLMSAFSYQLASYDLLWVSFNKNYELVLWLQRPSIFIVWHLSSTLPYSILTVKPAQTLANIALFYLDIVTLSPSTHTGCVIKSWKDVNSSLLSNGGISITYKIIYIWKASA